MSQISQALITGVTSFFATNIDDLAILTLFFAKANTTFRPRYIVLGQYLGFLGLVLASLPGYFGGMFLPRPWLGWLGLLPIAIGVYYILKKDSDENTIQVISTPETLGKQRSPFSSLFNPQIYRVAAVTLANGGDNIGVYVPLFASSPLTNLGVILGVFIIMIGLWCCIAYQLARHLLVSKTFTQYGNRIVPFILISLGMIILVESGTFSFLSSQ
jgi:cadmium resistance transport/sequestration family protein